MCNKTWELLLFSLHCMIIHLIRAEFGKICLDDFIWKRLVLMIDNFLSQPCEFRHRNCTLKESHC